MNMTKADFKKTALKVIVLAEVAASFTPTNKDDQVVELVGSLFKDDEKFDEVCELLGISDAPPVV